MTPFGSSTVANVFDSYPADVRVTMLALRGLIFATAAETEGVGQLEETLKWGEPSYLTSQTRSGTTVRIAWKRRNPGRYGLFVHCQTNLIETFRAQFPLEFEFDGNRGLLFNIGEAIPVEPLTLCISAALTYHRTRRSAARRPDKD